MFQNHLKLAWRRLLNNRLFSAVQLVGLTAGISACLLIGLFIHHEWTYDAMHAHADRIVKVNMEYSFGGEVVHSGSTGNKVAPTLAREFPEVEAAVRVMQYTEVVKSGAMLTEEAQFFYADSTFFQIFSFPLLKGDAVTALRDPWQVVLSESTARRYFGEADPIGKTLNIGKREAKVTGVM
ncbi:MAG TPA: ABC transporter permease, partial [Saprospiraceae bacterium]|nr:ABC transporter permease [Saprospiraceae bacterium]